MNQNFFIEKIVSDSYVNQNLQEQQEFQRGLGEMNDAFFGKDVKNLVISRMTLSQEAYLHYLELGSRSYPNQAYRYEAILNGLSAKEYLLILPYLEGGFQNEKQTTRICQNDSIVSIAG